VSIIAGVLGFIDLKGAVGDQIGYCVGRGLGEDWTGVTADRGICKQRWVAFPRRPATLPPPRPRNFTLGLVPFRRSLLSRRFIGPELQSNPNGRGSKSHLSGIVAIKGPFSSATVGKRDRGPALHYSIQGDSRARALHYFRGTTVARALIGLSPR
jgi:hypothetical protein